MFEGIILESKDGTLWKNNWKIETNTNKLLKLFPYNGCFSAPTKRCMQLSSSALQKEHSSDSTSLSLKKILFTKRILFSISDWKTFNFVSIITLSGHKYIDFQLKSLLMKYPAKLVLCTFQKFLFDIVLYSLICSSSISCFFNWMKVKKKKIHWISPTIQTAVFPQFR